jgi:hypothetical protein
MWWEQMASMGFISASKGWFLFVAVIVIRGRGEVKIEIGVWRVELFFSVELREWRVEYFAVLSRLPLNASPFTLVSGKGKAASLLVPITQRSTLATRNL